jgi:hypothetical protein
VIGHYERGVALALTVTTDVDANTYDVWVNGTTVAQGLRYRNGSYSLTGVTLASLTRDADFRIYSLAVSVQGGRV